MYGWDDNGRQSRLILEVFSPFEPKDMIQIPTLELRITDLEEQSY